MKEHALPQDITGYRFHIIGNMTLKQFAEVGAGCVVGFLIYNTNLTNYLKWPMILVVVGLGAFAAFVPFEERPFDHWIIAFFQALYRPTQFYWKRTVKIPDPFLYSPKTAVKIVNEVDLSPARHQRVKEYLSSINAKDSNALDPSQEQQIQSIMALFNSNTATSTFDTNAFVQVPEEVKSAFSIESTAPITTTTTTPIVDNSPQPEIVIGARAASAPAADIPIPNWSLPSDTTPTQPQTPVAQQPEPVNQFADTVSVSVPQMQFVSVNHPTPETVAPELQQLQTDQQVTNDTFIDAATVPQYTEQVTPTQAVVQNSKLPFPNKPTEPNKIVGMVIDKNNTPLQGAIVEILTPEGLPARAVKTNMLGQFFITTPLGNGNYSLRAEKDGFQFAAQELVVNGQILEPIEVRSL